MSKNTKNTYAFCLSDSVAEAVDSRCSGNYKRSQTLGRDLTRLYMLYRRALADVCFSTAEACLLTDAVERGIVTIIDNEMLIEDIEKVAYLQGLDRYWSCDKQILIEKLQKLNDLQTTAIVDAVERFWVAYDNKHEDRENNETNEKESRKNAVKGFFYIEETD